MLKRKTVGVARTSADSARTSERGGSVSQALQGPSTSAQADVHAPLASRWQNVQGWLTRYHWVVALLVYVVLSLIITYPLIFHLSDTIIGPGGGDSLWFSWYIWWFHNAVAAGQDPAFTHLIYALVPRVQLFAPSTYIGTVGALLMTVMPPLAAYNLVMLASFPLAGLTMYLLAGEFVKNRFVCFVVGFIFTFSTFHFWRAAGHASLAQVQWLPLLVWRTFAFYRRPRWQNAVWLGLSIAIIPLSDLYLTAYFLVPFALVFVIWLLVTDRGWVTQPRHLLLTGLAALVTLLVALPPLFTSLFQVDPGLQATIYHQAQVGNQLYSSDFLSYFLPNSSNPLLGWIGSRYYARMTSGPSIEQANYLGIVNAALGIGAFLFRRNRNRVTVFLLILGIVGGVLSLGPVVHIAGRVRFPGLTDPLFQLIYGLPVLIDFRAPNRMGPTAYLPMALLGAFTLSSLYDLLRQRLAGHHVWRMPHAPMAPLAMAALGIVAMGASLAEHIIFSFPYPSTPVRVPALYARMAADPTAGLVLDLPVAPRADDMYYQLYHHRGLVDGYPIRTSSAMVRSIENVPYLSFLDPVDDNIAHDSNVPNDVGGFGDIYPINVTFKQGLEEQGIRYVVYHVEAYPPEEPWMKAFLLQQLGKPFYDNSAEGLTAWRIDPTQPDLSVYRFTMGTGWLPGLNNINGHLGRFVQQDAQVLISAPRDGPQHLTMTAFPWLKPLTMVVSVNGVTVKTVQFTQHRVPETLDLGSVNLHQGTNVLQIHSAEGCSLPASVDPSNQDPRCFSFVVTQILLSPQ